MFDTEALRALSESIRRHGILQPPVVRQIAPDLYELIAGERRLRAALLAGMTSIPCLVRAGDDHESAELAIIENLQRRDLDMFEEAYAIATLCEKYRLTQEQVGQKLSVSQSYVANKLRLLRFDEETREAILRAGLTERHARALLRLIGKKELESALSKIVAEGLNVARSEALVDFLCSEIAPEVIGNAERMKRIEIFKDTIDRSVQNLVSIGIEAKRHVSYYGKKTYITLSIEE